MTAGGADSTYAGVEIVTIGNELLRGDTIDGNAAWLGRRLAAAGIRVVRRATVGDDVPDIQRAVAEALNRTGAVLCTGGLGPTSDDLTRPAIAALFGRTSHVDDAVLAAIEARFTARGIAMPPSNRSQAEVPDGARVFPNPAGTAPGLALEDDRGIAILLPGVPSELHALIDGGVLHHLRARWPSLRPVSGALLRTTGISESALYDVVRDLVPAVAPIDVAFLPGFHGVDVRLTAFGGGGDMLGAAAARFEERLGRWTFTREQADLAEVVGEALRERGMHVALAESCTGGLVARRLTDVPGASAWLHAGFVAYHNDAKQSLLGVPAGTLERHGAVSEETVRAMLEGAMRAVSAPAGIAITGVAGPGGGTESRPVGTVWIAAAAAGRTEAKLFRFVGTRTAIREFAGQAALRMLHLLLLGMGAARGRDADPAEAGR
jgi:nicotinamide-nucleotide amidase